MAKVAERVDLSLNKFECPFPDFLDANKQSYQWFLEEGIKMVLEEVSPIKDSLERMWKLEFLDYYFKGPEVTEAEALNYDLTYSQSMFVKTRLTSLKDGTTKEQDVYFADIPILTETGYFIINGVIRTIRHQMVRAEGIIFQEAKKSSSLVKNPYTARLIPSRGAWYVLEINNKGVITITLVRKRTKILVTSLLKALKGYTNTEILDLFKDVKSTKAGVVDYIKNTLETDKTTTKEDAIMNIYNKLRPNDLVNIERANRYVRGFFFNSRRFFLGDVGRYQLNQKLGLSFKEPKFRVKDLVEIIKRLIRVNTGEILADDIDSLMNRRIKSVGEVMVETLRSAMFRFERNVKDRMSRVGAERDITPSSLMNTKLISAHLNAFLGLSQLSKFMSQQNIFGQMEEIRRITSKGPGGLTNKNAGFSVRDVHFSHYSRLCAITTPEGQNAGLVLHLAIYSRLNKFGFIEAPYRKLLNTVENKAESTKNRILRESIEVGEKIYEKGLFITEKIAKELEAVDTIKEVKVYPFLTDEVEYMSYHDEKNRCIAMSTSPHDQYGNYLPGLITVRYNGEFILQPSEIIEYVDVRAWQIASIGLALIPFADRNYTYRTMMGSNMERQALPLVISESPLVGTGIEKEVARQSRAAIYADFDGIVEYADANVLIIKNPKNGKRFEYQLQNFVRTNDDTSYTQKLLVTTGEKFSKGDILVDGPSMELGELALGKNVLVAVMPYDGLNYDDGFVISERLIHKDTFTTVHINMYTQNLRETKNGPEILTSDIPRVNYKLLRNLTSEGVVRVGSLVKSGDILAGIVSQKVEEQLSPEEALLRAVFGDSAKEVKNNSLRMPYGASGVVIKTQIITKDQGYEMEPGVLKKVKVWVAELKNVSYGDKFAGFYGDKGCVSAVLPVQDMPYTEDGTPVDIIMTPLLVKRMNMGILYQIKYSNIAKRLGKKLAVPNFEDIDTEWLDKELSKFDKVKMDKQVLYDGRTGEPFAEKVNVGYRYFMRLKHIAKDKMHARSTGPYSVVTQQPVGGKANQGGQRVGEMEVWALEAHGVPHVLQEILTIKSDDVVGRTKAYKSIIQGEDIKMENVPTTFNVLLRELNSLGIKVELNKE